MRMARAAVEIAARAMMRVVQMGSIGDRAR